VVGHCWSRRSEIARSRRVCCHHPLQRRDGCAGSRCPPGGEKLHNRHVLTELGGVAFGLGLDEQDGDAGQAEDLHRLGSAPHALRWALYAGAHPAFVLDAEFVVQGRGRSTHPRQRTDEREFQQTDWCQERLAPPSSLVMTTDDSGDGGPWRRNQELRPASGDAGGIVSEWRAWPASKRGFW